MPNMDKLAMVFTWFFKNNKKKKSQDKMSRIELADEWVKYGEDMANANRLEEALKCFDNALQINARNEFAWGDRALVLDRQQKIEQALNSFSRSIEINPENPITWLNKGLTLIKAKRLSESIECFDKAIENRGDYAKAYYNKGRALSMMGEINKSQECFDRARKLDPLLYMKLKRMK
jgi:tetratricopeptide (TPR) repeat protein